MSKRDEDENEVAVDTGTGTKKRRRLGPNPRPPSQWDTPSTGSSWGPPGISPVPPSLWPLPQAGESLGFGGATAERKSALDIANELAMAAETDRRASAALRGTNLEARARPSYVPPEVPAGLTFDEWYGQNMVPFDETPYRNYISFLQNQNEDTMARINAMYAQLGDTAQANIDRVGEIYESGTANLGDVYGSAYGAVEDAYASSQQQAADQMARLGIEAAAPAVMDPMALSQAEALSGIESQRASGLGATQQYGTTAQDFASQMQQVASQQGLEVSQQILRDLLAREAEAEFQLEQARANYNPYASLLQQMELEGAWNQMQNPQIDWRQEQAMANFAYQQEQDDTNLLRQYYFEYLGSSNYNQIAARDKLLSDIQSGLLGERLRQWVASNPGVIQQITQ